MRVDASQTTDSSRALERRSFLRRVWCDPNLPREMTDALWSGDVDRVLFDTVPLQVKDRCVVGRCDCEIGPLLVKRHVWGDFSRTVRMAFREPAALRCARLGLYLSDCGFRTPRPRATVNYRVGPWTYRSYLITDYIEGTSLYRYIRFETQTDEELRHVAGQVAQLWHRLIELGISHNDLKPENFIVDDNLDVWLIDLEKTRESGKAERQQEREVFDVKNFLHIRGWHHRLEARSLFAEAFLRTPHGHWLKSTVVEQIAAQPAPLETEIDAEISAVILCEGGIEMPLARQAIDSVADIADEVVLVGTTQSGESEVLKRINLCAPEQPSAKPSASSPVARFPWILAIYQNEGVTPFLSKELQQMVTSSKVKLAVRISLERQYFGQTIKQPASLPPVRLFQQADCAHSITDGSLEVSVAADRGGRLTGFIQVSECSTVAEYVERLNNQSSAAALGRFRAGSRANPARGLARAALRFATACVRPSGIRSGWTGLQIAMLDGVFAWVEEAKLRQFASEFRHANSLGVTSEIAAEPSSDSRRSKAA